MREKRIITIQLYNISILFSYKSHKHTLIIKEINHKSSNLESSNLDIRFAVYKIKTWGHTTPTKSAHNFRTQIIIRIIIRKIIDRLYPWWISIWISDPGHSDLLWSLKFSLNLKKQEAMKGLYTEPAYPIGVCGQREGATKRLKSEKFGNSVAYSSGPTLLLLSFLKLVSFSIFLLQTGRQRPQKNPQIFLRQRPQKLHIFFK